MNNLSIAKKHAYLISDKINRRYFSGADIEEGLVLITSEKTYYFIDARYFHAVKEKVANPVLYEGLDTIKNFLTENKIQTLFVDYDTTTLTDYNNYKSVFGLQIKDCSCEIKKARAIKSQKELSLIKKACAITQKVYFETIKFIKVGVTEREIASKIEELFIANGAQGLSFETIVAFGVHSAIPHHQTGETRLEENQVVLIDMGCFYEGYASDLTRTVFFGSPNDEFINAYNLVLEANVKAEEIITSGIGGKEADEISRKIFKNANLEEYFTHSLGHGVGLEIHEYPRLSKVSQDILVDNMVFSIEPGLYFNDKFGIRIEDTVTLNNGKIERLFTDDKNLLILKN